MTKIAHPKTTTWPDFRGPTIQPRAYRGNRKQLRTRPYGRRNGSLRQQERVLPPIGTRAMCNPTHPSWQYAILLYNLYPVARHRAFSRSRGYCHTVLRRSTAHPCAWQPAFGRKVLRQVISVQYGKCNYPFISNLVKSKCQGYLMRQEKNAENQASTLPLHENIRGAQAYK